MTVLEQTTAADKLRELCPPGTTVYGIVRNVAASGMSRVIDFYTIKDNEPRYLSGLIHNVTGIPFDRGSSAGLRVRGGGMDMIFAVVYDLSCKLYNGDGYALSHSSL